MRCYSENPSMTEINMVCLDAQMSFCFPHWSVAWTDLFLCKDSGSVVLLQVFVGEVLSVNQDKADCLEVFFYFFSHTLAITTLDVLFFPQTIQWLKMFFCFTPCKILWKCKSLIGWDACWSTIALVVRCIIYHLFFFFFLSFEWIVLFPHSLFSYWTALQAGTVGLIVRMLLWIKQMVNINKSLFCVTTLDVTAVLCILICQISVLHVSLK